MCGLLSDRSDVITVCGLLRNRSERQATVHWEKKQHKKALPAWCQTSKYR